MRPSSPMTVPIASPTNAIRSRPASISSAQRMPYFDNDKLTRSWNARLHIATLESFTGLDYGHVDCETDTPLIVVPFTDWL